MRYQQIHVVNNVVEPQAFVACGLFAVVIQHELDHLVGKLLPDVAVKQSIGSNEKCPCKSGMKYKQCCGKKNE